MSRRAKGEGSIFESPKGSGVWYAQITLADGRQIQRQGPSKGQAREKLKALQRQAAAEVALGKQQPTLWEWWLLWIDQYAAKLKPNIKDDYRGIGRRYVERSKIGRKRLIVLTPTDVQDWVNALARQGLAPRTVRNAHARLRRSLAVALRHGYVEKNVAVGIELPAEETGDDLEEEDLTVQSLTFAQARQLIAILEGHRLQPLYHLAINLGLRQGELLGLTWDCVDLEGRRLTIKQQLKRVAQPGAAAGDAKSWALTPPKTKAARRVIKLSTELVEVLRAHLKNLREEQLLHGKPFRERDPFRKRGGLVFVTQTGAPIHGAELLRHLHRWLQKAELPVIRFHDLRHTAATLMIADRVQIPAVSTILGHANPGITMRIYAHALEDATAEAVAGLSRRLGGM